MWDETEGQTSGERCHGNDDAETNSQDLKDDFQKEEGGQILNSEGASDGGQEEQDCFQSTRDDTIPVGREGTV